MDKLKKLYEWVSEVIVKDDAHLNELKLLAGSFFKEMNQGEIDKIGKEKLAPLVKCLDILTKKGDLNEIDRAFLEFYFVKKPVRYEWFSYSGKIKEEKLKKAIIEIHESNVLGPESDKELMSYIGWVLTSNNYLDEVQLNNSDNSFRLELSLRDYEKPEMDLLLIGTKNTKNKELIEKVKKSLS